jgi:hypothetical protein
VSGPTPRRAGTARRAARDQPPGRPGGAATGPGEGRLGRGRARARATGASARTRGPRAHDDGAPAPARCRPA